MRTISNILSLIYAVSFSLYAQPAFIGAARCAECHAAEFQRQSRSEHARALYPAAQHPLAAEFLPTPSLQRSPDFDFRFFRDPRRGLLMRVSNPDSALLLTLDWAFGAGNQAVTFVSKSGPDTYLEDYFSYYPKTRAMGVTPGQERLTAHDVANAAGFPHPGLDIVSCFGCHSTGTVKITDGTVQPTEQGVHCEACHGPGAAHADSAGRTPVIDPRHMTGSQINDLCARCHRSPSSFEGKVDWDDPWNIRFQPAYLARSACFLKSRGRLSCTSCHGPHDALEQRDPQHYNRVCASCHPKAHAASALTDCTGCHMPRVSPREPLSFTNHWIAVYRDGKRPR